MNPCARESKAATGRFLERKLISDYGQISFHESQPGAANGKNPGALSKRTRGSGRADAGSGAGFTAHQSLHYHGPRYNSFSFSVNSAKRGARFLSTRANLEQRTEKLLGRFPRELGALDERMLARAPASQLIKVSTIVDLGTTVFLFLYHVTFAKRGFG